jgi:hypothetical protein
MEYIRFGFGQTKPHQVQEEKLMNRNKRLSMMMSMMVIGNLLVGFPMKNAVYPQSAESLIQTKATQLSRTMMQEAEQAAFDLLKKHNAREPITGTYYQERWAKILAALNEMDRVGWCKTVVDAVPGLTQKYDPVLTEDLANKLKTAGVTQAEITQLQQLSESQIIQAASTISQKGYCDFFRELLTQLDRELAMNMADHRIQYVSFVPARPLGTCIGGVLKTIGAWVATTATCSTAATGVGTAACIGAILAATGTSIDAVRDCSRS